MHADAVGTLHANVHWERGLGLKLAVHAGARKCHMHDASVRSLTPTPGRLDSDSVRFRSMSRATVSIVLKKKGKSGNESRSSYSLRCRCCPQLARR